MDDTSGNEVFFLLIFSGKIIGPKMFDPKTVLLILANFNTPVQIRPFLQLSSRDRVKLDQCFVIMWMLCGLENIARLICIYAFMSEEVFSKLFSPFTTQSFACLVILLEFAILILWRIFFNKLYLWRNLITLTTGQNNPQHLIEGEVKISGDVRLPNENQELEVLDMKLFARDESKESKES